MDRSPLAMFYPLSAWRGHLTREEAIECLFRHWQSASNDEHDQSGIVSDSLLEALCMMSPQQHRDELLPAIEQGNGSQIFSPQQLREMVNDPSQGEAHVLSWLRETHDARKLIESSVMFDEASDRPETPMSIDQAPPQLPRETLPATNTVRHTETSVGRNDPCPCGSGKKFKKCCRRL